MHDLIHSHLSHVFHFSHHLFILEKVFYNKSFKHCYILMVYLKPAIHNLLHWLTLETWYWRLKIKISASLPVLTWMLLLEERKTCSFLTCCRTSCQRLRIYRSFHLLLFFSNSCSHKFLCKCVDKLYVAVTQNAFNWIHIFQISQIVNSLTLDHNQISIFKPIFTCGTLTSDAEKMHFTPGWPLDSCQVGKGSKEPNTIHQVKTCHCLCCDGTIMIHIVMLHCF